MDPRNNPIILDGGRLDTRTVSRTRTSLLSRVLMIASLGFLVSALGVYAAPPAFSQGMFLFCVIASFALIFAIRAARQQTLLAFGLFLLLAGVMGFEISPWINMLLHTGRSAVVLNAALTTGVGMAVLGMGAQIATFDYRKVGNFAIAALLALVIVGVLSAFFHFVSPTLYSWASLLIFSVLVVVDFMRIRAGGDGATAVELAVSIYLDGINIFLALTRIFSGRRD